VSSIAPNKPNFPTPEINLRVLWEMIYKEFAPILASNKQSQSNPIAAGVLSEAQRSRMDLAGVLIAADEVALSAAPAESNGVVEWVHSPALTGTRMQPARGCGILIGEN
jgi:hypothetical protein